MRAFMYTNMSLRNSKMLFAPYNLPKLPTEAATQSEKDEILNSYREYMTGADRLTEQNVIAATLRLMQQLPADYQPEGIFEYINKSYKGNFDAFAKACMDKSIYGSEANLTKYLSKPSQKALDNDPLYTYFKAMLSHVIKYQGIYLSANNKLTTPRRIYMAALMDMQKGKAMYPDANSTMRCTYGTVCDYYPSDGVQYLHYTTAEGILEKEIPNDPEFDVSPKLKKLILDKDFGQYAMKDGKLPVCFITNNDITGGNSGSPVLNGNGELIGCAFDGNIEALCSDIIFDTELQRCICVDIRYVLFVIDKFAGAKRFINEMEIVK